MDWRPGYGVISSAVCPCSDSRQRNRRRQLCCLFEADPDFADRDLVAVREQCARNDSVASDKGSVLAAEIFDCEVPMTDRHDPRVAPRDACTINRDRCGEVTTNDDLTLHEGNAPAGPHQLSDRRRSWRHFHSRGTERVAIAMNRSNENGVTSVILQSRSDLGYDSGKARVGDERVGPQGVLQLLLRESTRTSLREEGQELECLRRKMYRFITPEKFTSVNVERVPFEAQSHTQQSQARDQFRVDSANASPFYVVNEGSK